ncbi:YadA-like family protein [uncultured Halomonas sp.]|uniref:YadA-like family protein n=1 Tax=uncultured Halomonas sp. TaxID=173971 RepID=UPI002628B5DE|nr:YadA-like family protein [uncultured Halomonas sp.]
MAIGLLAVGAAVPTVSAQDAAFDNLTVSGDAILSALQVSGAATFDGAATFNDSLTVGGVNVANAISANASAISTNASDISANASAISTNTSDISTNTSDISTNTSAISTNTSNISTNANNISALDGRVTAASAGWDISAEGGAEENVAPGGAVDFSGDGNIEVGRSGTDLTFGLADEVEVAGSLSVTGGPSITAAGIDAGGKAITNVAAGNLTATSSDVVIGSQIYDLFIEEGAGGVRYFRALSAQPDSQALGAESIAIGPNSVAAGDSSLAAGDGASITATGEGAIALGQGASAGGDPLGGAGAIAVGRDSVAGANSAVALGVAAQATAGNATAVGAGAAASGGGSIALGKADATGSNAFAAGTGAYAGSPGGIALGTGAGVGTDGTSGGDRTHHIAIGTEAGRNVVGNQTTAIGYSAGSDITGDHNVAVGSHAGQNLQGDFNVAIGHEANRNAGVVERATAVGGQTQAGRNGVSVGYGATSEDSGVALGANTSADNLGVALGRNATAEGGSVALGSGSAARSTDAAGTGYLTGSDFTDGTVVSVGNTNPSGVRTTRRIVNVADGSQAYDAVNVGQLKGAQQSVANLVGGNVTLGANGSFEGYVVELQDSSGTSHQYATVAEAINAVSSGSINVLPGDAVIYNPDGTVTVAEGVVGTDAVNVEQLNRVVAENGVKYFSVNSSEPANRDNAEASGTDAIAIGPATSADGASSLAAGHLAHSAGDESVALGHRVEALGNESTAIGSESDAYGDGGVAIGLQAKSQGENSIVMGTRAQADPKTTDATVDNAVVIGTDAEATADNGIAIGESALASEVRAVAQGFDAHATADDAMAFGSNSRASGTSAQASGTNASASGTNAQASGTNASASGLNAQASGTDSIGYATDGIAMGTGAVAGINDPFNQEPERNAAGIAIGKQSLADEQHALALGVEAEARAASSTAIGDGAEATATAQDGLAVGSGARVTAQNAAAFGQSAEAVAGEALAMGSAARAAAQGATAIGEGAQANHQGSVALGSGAVTAEAVGTSSMTVDKNTYDFAGISPVATVSVGTAGAERTLTNVAAGRVSATSTDAINGSQLYGTNQAVNALADNLDTAGDSVAGVLGGNAAYDPDTHQVTMSNVGGTGQGTVDEAIEYAAQGWNVTANNESSANIAPGGAVDFSSTDGNIAINRTGTNLTFDLDDDIEIGNRVTVGGTVIDGDSVTTNNLTVGGDTFVVAGDTVTYDGNEIATQADGLSFAGDTGGAINKTLGDTTPLTVSGELAAGDASSGANLRVDSDGNQLNLVMARNLTELDSVTTGNSVLNTGGLTVDDGAGNITEVGADGLTIAGGPSVTTSGIDAGDLKITGVADGSVNGTSSDAINGSQLFGVADSVGDVIGGNAVVNADGSVTTSDIGNTGEDNVHDAIDVVNTAANAGWNATDAAGSAANIGPNGEVRFEGDSNISVAQTGADDAGVIAVALNENVDLGDTGSVTTGDSVLDTDGLTVDDGTGNRTDLGAGSLSVAGAGTTIAIDGGAGDITGLTNTDLDGADFAQAGRAATEEQLDLVNQTANAGWNLTGSGVDEVNIGPDGVVDFQGDGNISVAQTGADDDGQIDITLNPDLNVDSVTAGDSVLDTDGLAVTDTNGNQTITGATGTTVTDAAGNETVVDASGVTVGDDVTLGDSGLVIAGGPSVTTGGIDAGNQVVSNVANGVADTDAVNVSQLTGLAETPLTFAGDSGTNVDRKLGETVNLVGGETDATALVDGNIGVVADGSDTLSIQLAENIDLGETGSVTTGDTVMNDDGVSVNDGAGNTTDVGAGTISVAGAGNTIAIDGGAGDISGLTNTDLDGADFAQVGRAATEEQLDLVNQTANAGWNATDAAGNAANIGPDGEVRFEGDSNISVAQTGADDAGVIAVALNEDIDLGETGSVTTGDTVMNDGGVSVDDGAGNTTDVGAGTINVAGGGNTIAIDGGAGDITGLTNTDLDGTDFAQAGRAATEEQLNLVNQTANAGWNLSGSGANQVNIGPNGAVDFQGDGNISVAQTGADDAGVIAVALNENLDLGETGSVTTGDTVVNDAGVSVDDGAGNTTDVGAGTINVAGGGNTITLDGGAGDITGLTNTDLDGADFAQAGRAATEEQLNLVNQTANAGWNLSGSGANQVNIGPNGAVDFQGDGNISVAQRGADDDGQIDITLNRDLDVDSVTAGEASLDTAGLVVNDNTANPTATTTVEAGTITLAANPITGPANQIVIDANSGTIGGLTNTTFDPNSFTSGQAATEDQLGQVYTVANAGWHVSVDGEGVMADGSNNVGPDGVVDFTSDDNIVIDRTGTDLAFGLADSITLGDGDTAITVDGENGLVSVGDTIVSGAGVTVGDDVSLDDGGLTIDGGPSVTVGGIDAGGQVVTNVAAGEVSSTSTDAINGSQLYEVQQVANAGWNLSGSGADAVNIGPNGAVDFRGDSNITVSQTGMDQSGVIEVELNDAIILGAGDTAVTVDGENGLVSVGDTVMDGDGVSIGDSVSLDGSGLVIAGGPSVTIGGIDAGGLQVTNVASGLGGQTLDQISGSDLMNAVNVGDLQQVAGEIGQDVAAAKTEVEAGSNITVSQTTGDDGQTIYTVETERDVDFDSINVGSVNIDKDNVDENGNTIIAGVGRGEISADSTDAVNGSQLHEVQEELGDINGALDGGMNFAADEGDDVNRTLGDTVAITGDDNITTQTTGDGVQVTLNNELNVDSVTTGKTTVSDAGVTIAGGPSMTADGIDGGGKRITNVAAGVDATDAVNVGQMQELNQRFAQEIHNVHGRISDVERNANAGTASALAASTVPQAWLPGKSMVGVGAGTYEGESAISVGISRLSDNGRWVIQGKVTGDSQSNFGAGIGAGWHW